MINDQIIRSAVVREWSSVRKLCASGKQYVVDGLTINETPPASFYSLPLLLAYAVLDQVLAELINQGTIPCTKENLLLEEKMAASMNAIAWQNYSLIERGMIARNELADDAKLLDQADCYAYIDAIEAELKAWNILKT